MARHGLRRIHRFQSAGSPVVDGTERIEEEEKDRLLFGEFEYGSELFRVRNFDVQRSLA